MSGCLRWGGPIFEEQLRNGRPAPIYDRTSSVNVVVVLPGGVANLDFISCITEESQQGAHLRLDDLLVLNNLWHERRCTSAEAAVLIQKHGSISRSEMAQLCKISENQARTVITRLLKHGQMVRSGKGRGTRYESKR